MALSVGPSNNAALMLFTAYVYVLHFECRKKPGRKVFYDFCGFLQ